MTASQDPLRFACPDCGKRLVAGSEQSGKIMNCPACNAFVSIPIPPRVSIPAPEIEASPPVVSKQRITVTCRLCETRAEVPIRFVGKKLKCPDCGARTEIRLPEEKTIAQRPAAMDGWQYEVYEGDNQPWAADLIAAEKRRAVFECQLCQTRMDVPLSVVGKRVKCPDCGSATRVLPPETKQEKPTLAPSGEEYQIDGSSAPPEPLHQGLYDTHTARPLAGYRELADAKARRATGRPKPPRFALLVGVLRMWRSSSMWMALFGLSGSLLLITVLGATLLALLSAGDMSSALGIVFVPIPLVTGFLWATIFSSIFIELIVESSEGGDSIHNWPTADASQLGGPIAYLLIALSAAALPGSLVAYGLPEAYREHAIDLGIWLFLPWILLSQLEQSAAFGIFSPKLLRTLRYAPGTWLFFYIETLLLAAGTFALALALVLLIGPLGLLILVPLSVFEALIYARLLGRLSWIIADVTPGALEKTAE